MDESYVKRGSLWVPESMREQEIEKKLDLILETLESLKPQGFLPTYLDLSRIQCIQGE